MISPRFRELADKMVSQKMEGKMGKAGAKPAFKFRREGAA
jgi:hypothetical protein